MPTIKVQGGFALLTVRSERPNSQGEHVIEGEGNRWWGDLGETDADQDQVADSYVDRVVKDDRNNRKGKDRGTLDLELGAREQGEEHGDKDDEDEVKVHDENNGQLDGAQQHERGNAQLTNTACMVRVRVLDGSDEQRRQDRHG